MHQTGENRDAFLCRVDSQFLADAKKRRTDSNQCVFADFLEGKHFASHWCKMT